MAMLGVGFDLKKAVGVVALLIILSFYLGYSFGYKSGKGDSSNENPYLKGLNKNGMKHLARTHILEGRIKIRVQRRVKILTLKKDKKALCNKFDAPPNNSFNPTLTSEPFIIKLFGFCYVVAIALASGGLIRALGFC